MPEFVIRDVEVRFPFEPYEVQKAYMSKVIECLQNGSNGILESPTGTGKTLCLLCASLAWLETAKAEYEAKSQGAGDLSSVSMLEGAVGSFWLHTKTRPPKIIYASRTHSQLSQAISELKRTTYRYIKVSVLGSRDQLCVHPRVSKETNNNNKVYMCQVHVKGKTCHFYNQVENKKNDAKLFGEIADIEDLVTLGKKNNFCPYYMTRELIKNGDIIFMPYNYLLDSKTRKAHGVDLEGTVVIFDEAHNIEKVCEDGASHQISSTNLALCIAEVTQIMKKVQENSESSDGAAAFPVSSQGLADDFTPDDLCTLKTLFLELEKAIDSIPLSSDGSGATFPGSFMFELLEKADITFFKKAVIIELLEKLIQYLTTNSSSPFERKGAGLQSFLDLIYTVYSRDCYNNEHMDFVKRSYKVHVGIEEPKKKWGTEDNWHVPKASTLSSKTGRIVSFWCFYPGFGMQSLIDQGVKCVILTSGTLSPLASFASELKLTFPVQLQNPHIIKKHQVWAGVVCKGPDGVSLNSSFKTRFDPKYKRSLGLAINTLAQVIPEGLLVFFPSYSIMRECQEEWEKLGIWSRLSLKKPIFLETKGKEEFVTVMDEYYNKINDPSSHGACFMAVCRGKVSEGLDFADSNGRAVIVTGLPYPPFKDPRVVLKQKYLDEVYHQEKQGLTGQAWYSQEATRAVNQAVGRIIRHKDDYGAIILCDSRFASPHLKKEMSAWIQPHMNTYNEFGPAVRGISHFFKETQTLLPQPEGKKKLRQHITIKYEELTPSTSHPVTAQCFEAATSRSVASQNTVKHSTEAQTTENSLVQCISNLNYPKPKVAKTAAENTGSLFSRLEQEVEVEHKEFIPVNSSNVRPLPDYTNIRQHRRKRMKFIPRIEVSASGNADIPEQVLKPLNPEASGSKLCQPTELELKTMESDLEKPAKKLKESKAYISEVRAAISRENYAVFSAAVKEYKKGGSNFETLKVIPTLFSQDPAQQALMKGFLQFLKKPQEKERFLAFIADARQT